MTARISKLIRTATAGLACGLALAAAPAFGAVVINKDTTVVSNIPGLTGFSTSGDEMVGMSVRANFSGGFTETLIWAATGAGSGGVSGTGWGLSVSGDTFTADWQFTIGANTGQLLSFVLSGNSGLTVLDTTDPNPGSDGSAQGADFEITGGFTLPDGVDVNAIYSDVVALIPDLFVGDLFHVLTVDFGNAGPRTNFTFRQDTDNDSRLRAPEPGSLALLGLALAGLGFARRRATR